MKHTFYFPHDYHARHDPKLEKIYLKHGHIAWGIYWHLVEMLYEQGGYLLLEDIALYAKGEQSLSERFTDVIMQSGLFDNDKTRFWSKSCLERLEHMQDKREKAAISGSIGGKAKANAKRTLSECVAIKEIKDIKEIKEKKDVPLPTLSDLKEYFIKNNSTENEANKCFHHYEANGWKTGKNPVKKWRSVASGWILRCKDYGKPTIEGRRITA